MGHFWVTTPLKIPSSCTPYPSVSRIQKHGVAPWSRVCRSLLAQPTGREAWLYTHTLAHFTHIYIHIRWPWLTSSCACGVGYPSILSSCHPCTAAPPVRRGRRSEGCWAIIGDRERERGRAKEVAPKSDHYGNPGKTIAVLQRHWCVELLLCLGGGWFADVALPTNVLHTNMHCIWSAAKGTRHKSCTHTHTHRHSHAWKLKWFQKHKQLRRF